MRLFRIPGLFSSVESKKRSAPSGEETSSFSDETEGAHGPHVYCTRCRHFRLDPDDSPYCPYEADCWIWDCEDSTPLSVRPHYRPADTLAGSV